MILSTSQIISLQNANSKNSFALHRKLAPLIMPKRCSWLQSMKSFSFQTYTLKEEQHQTTAFLNTNEVFPLNVVDPVPTRASKQTKPESLAIDDALRNTDKEGISSDDRILVQGTTYNPGHGWPWHRRMVFLFQGNESKRCSKLHTRLWPKANAKKKKRKRRKKKQMSKRIGHAVDKSLIKFAFCALPLAMPRTRPLPVFAH